MSGQAAHPAPQQGFKGLANNTSERLHTGATVQDFLERYEVGETVGVGGFAVVKKGRDKLTGEPVAIKVVDKSRYSAGDNSLEREIQVLLQVDHPNCIKLENVYITPRKVYLVTELVTGGELLDRVTEKGNYSEEDSRRLIKQILSGVAYLHSHGIVHRDLKLENMILQNERDDSPVKIADFGLSKFFSPETVLSTMCGSPQYVAPEVLGVGDGVTEYSPAVDMWSIGVILFILLSGYSPFDDDNDAVLFEKIKKGNYDADDPIWEHISVGAKDAVARLLTVDTRKRLSAAQALMHPWIDKGIRSPSAVPAVAPGAPPRSPLATNGAGAPAPVQRPGSQQPPQAREAEGDAPCPRSPLLSARALVSHPPLNPGQPS